VAGYIFNLDSIESLQLYSENGIYSTKFHRPPNNQLWKIPQEGTFADYSTMKAGDNVYFFIQRKIYGIGELINIENDCKFSNYTNASQPLPFEYNDKQDELLWDEGEYSINQRWLCVFKPSPYFFLKGIDMDDVLSSNPSAFKMLRALWKVSFIKFDGIENQAFKDIILKSNEEFLTSDENNNGIFHFSADTHEIITNKINQNYYLNLDPILNTCHEDTYIRHEMAIEAGLLYQLATEDLNTINTFGHWDYLSHQVVASPFKPIDYMDKMDIFGYSYIDGYEPTISKFLTIEIKKDSADIESIDQLLKYVDWINEEYAHNDYRMIYAFLIAYDFSDEVIQYLHDTAVRKFIIGRRPANSLSWSNLRLIKYNFDSQSNRITFDAIA